MENQSIIPLPRKVSICADSFILTENTQIVTDEPNRDNAKYLQNRLSAATGFPFLFAPEGADPGIFLHLTKNSGQIDGESYHLHIVQGQVKIESPTTHGVFNGIQTLLQLLPSEIESSDPRSDVEWRIPGIQISDGPRFPWRGFMLDEGRHFHGKETVLNLLDMMASLKMNIFHWHLTEDQGWRIQIRRYPRLTEIGAARIGTAQKLWDMGRNRHDGIPHLGYYTQDEIREIVAYASDRFITIVPEIEIPGHSLAALTAYPEYSCTGGPFEVPTRFGIFRDIYCPGKEGTFSFLKNILDELMDLFPGQYIHIGGDEAPKTRWKKCPDCQRRMLDEGIQDEHDLQSYFTERVADHVAGRGRKVIAWNQALSEEMHPDALIQYWLGNRKGLIEAVRNGRRTINSSYLDTYLDHSYALTPLSRIYRFEPVFKELSPTESENILGIEAPLWTEFVPDRARLDFQVFPRLLAVAETGWTAEDQRDFSDFRSRLDNYEKRLDILGIRYARDIDVQPPWYKCLFGLLTIIQPQRKTAG